jgi:hypothetical protein
MEVLIIFASWNFSPVPAALCITGKEEKINSGALKYPPEMGLTAFGGGPYIFPGE